MSASAERPASTVAASLTARIRRSRSTTNIAFAERRNAVQKTGAQPGSLPLAGSAREGRFACCDVGVKRAARAFDPQVDAGRPVDRAAPRATAHRPAGVMPGRAGRRPMARSCDLAPAALAPSGDSAASRPSTLPSAPADEICAGGPVGGEVAGRAASSPPGWPWCCGSGSPQRPPTRGRALGGSRTRNLPLTRRTLCQLSYEGDAIRLGHPCDRRRRCTSRRNGGPGGARTSGGSRIGYKAGPWEA